MDHELIHFEVIFRALKVIFARLREKYNVPASFVFILTTNFKVSISGIKGASIPRFPRPKNHFKAL